MSVEETWQLTNEYARAHEALDRGFFETIEYRKLVAVNPPLYEYRSYERAFPGLLHQLEQLVVQPLVTGPGGPSGPNKAGSKPPSNSQYSDLLDTIHEQAIKAYQRLEGAKPESNNLSHVLVDIRHSIDRNVMERGPDCARVVSMAQAWVRQARVALGFETRHVTLANTSCHLCGGVLQVACDASTDVECVGCGHSYDRLRWIDLL